MRSIRLLAATTVMLAAAWSCGGGGTDQGTNPVAAFDQQCTNLSCTFADHSTPAGGISTWAWDFGDPTSTTNTANIQSPSHSFTAPGTFNVKLTVTDASGASNSKTNPVTVTGAANTPPVANFDLPATCTAGTPCGFHSTSTDAEGNATIVASHWDFGDLTSATNTADTPDATHTFASSGPYNVTLTVTDDQSAASTPVIKALTVSPKVSQSCTTSGKIVDCNLTVTQKATVKFVMVSHDCQFSGNKLSTTGPVVQTVFFNLCNRSVNPPDEHTITDAAGAPLVLQPGTTITVRFQAGLPGPTDPPAGDAGVRVVGNSPNWTLNIDDGGLAGTAREPDFNDAVVNVIATPAP
jgi:PKD repeat protein